MLRSDSLSEFHSESRSRTRPRRTLRAAFHARHACLVAGAALLLIAGELHAQEAAETRGAATPQAAADAELEAARAALRDAAERLERARESAEQARQDADAARRARESAERKAAARSPKERSADAEATAREALERARAAEEKAIDARREALLAQQALRDHLAKRATDRRGFYLGGGAFWAPEDFASDLNGENAWGLWGRLGYRAHPHIAVELRFDGSDDFEVETRVARGNVRAYISTVNLRAFLLTGRVQPYAGVGIGAAVYEADGSDLDGGRPFEERDSEAVFRPSVGLDLYLTPSLLLNLDAAYIAPGDGLIDFAFGTLGGGLELRF